MVNVLLSMPVVPQSFIFGPLLRGQRVAAVKI
jgi:hypothetical protein